MYATLQSRAIANRDQTVTGNSQSHGQRFDFLKFLSAQEKKLYRRIPDEMDHVSHPSFASADIEERFFGEDSKVSMPRWTYPARVSEESPPRTAKPTVLSYVDEKTLFLRYNSARYGLHKLIEIGSTKCVPG